MRTGNPALNARTFSGSQDVDTTARAEGGYTGEAPSRLATGELMTLDGAVSKTAILSLLLIGGASWTWRIFFTTHSIEAVQPWLIASTVAGFVVAMATIIKKTWAPFTAPAYAAFEGLALGALSSIFEAKFPGIVIQAVALTMGTLLSLLFAYKSRLIRPDQNFRLGIVAATGGVCVVYLVDLALGFFGTQIPMIHQSGVVGILFSLFVVILAALNLVLDFDFIESGVEQGAPKYMEWYAAFGLMVTLVWLYLEILRLLAKSRSRD